MRLDISFLKWFSDMAYTMYFLMMSLDFIK